MANRVKELRKVHKLSQIKLAELVNTSQQQIQRIESCSTEAKLELAMKISFALGSPLEEAFPGVTKSVKSVKNGVWQETNREDQWQKMSKETGVEGDPRIWIFKFLLRGHKKTITYEITAADHRRLFSLVQDDANFRVGDDDTQFILFDAPNITVAINRREIVYCTFLFEIFGSDEDVDVNHDEVAVYFCGNDSPLNFDVSSDEVGSREEDEDGEMENILGMLQDGMPASERIHFHDSGESVFVRVGDLAMLTVPLSVIDPVQLDDE
jgi:putative transcriptional regulator